MDKPTTANEKNFMDVYCKDVRTIRFVFLENYTNTPSGMGINSTGGISSNPTAGYPTPYQMNALQSQALDKRKTIFELLQRQSFPHFYELFAFYYRPKYLESLENPLKAAFDIENEYQRMKIPAQLWRISHINQEYTYCSTYPSKIIIPTEVSDEQLKEVFPFRSKGRMAILTYFHTNTATITRCAQPRVGVTNARSEADESLMDYIRLANKSNQQTLYLFDARPKANAIANQAMGMGYEKISPSSGRYQYCKLEFLSIDNIHVMRDSYNKLQKLCETTFKDDKNFYNLLDQTHWLSYIKLVLSCSVKIAKIIDEEGASVLLHCSDGWDRTAQLASLAQLFLCPFYRTIKGSFFFLSSFFLPFFLPSSFFLLPSLFFLPSSPFLPSFFFLSPFFLFCSFLLLLPPSSSFPLLPSFCFLPSSSFFLLPSSFFLLPPSFSFPLPPLLLVSPSIPFLPFPSLFAFLFLLFLKIMHVLSYSTTFLFYFLKVGPFFFPPSSISCLWFSPFFLLPFQ